MRWAAWASLSAVPRNHGEVLHGLLLPFNSQISCRLLDFSLSVVIPDVFKLADERRARLESKFCD